MIDRHRKMLFNIGAESSLHLTVVSDSTSYVVPIARLRFSEPSRIDWGDGTADALAANTNHSLSHTYTSVGTFLITVAKARKLTGIWLTSANIGWLNTVELQNSAITDFTLALATNCTANSEDMKSWRPITWRLYNVPSGTFNINSASMINWRPTSSWRIADMPAGTYSIDTSHMVDWRPTVLWRLNGMPAGSYSFAASCMRGWVGIREIFAYSLTPALNETVVDTIVNDIYAGRNGYTFATPALNIKGTNAAASGIYQASASPSTGKEKIYTLINDNNSEGFKKWAIEYN
jgi:hypothetical protein